MIFVDTSVLVDYLRGQGHCGGRDAGQPGHQQRPLRHPVPLCQEILQGARDEREWRLLRGNLSTQRLALPADQAALHWEAARIFFDCRRRGLTVRSSIDCLIAAQA